MTTKPQSTTEETARLLPCPLFGHLPDKGEFTSGPYISVSGAPDMPKFYAVVCPGCCSTAYDEDRERVIKKWNTRISPASTAPVVDEPHKMINFLTVLEHQTHRNHEYHPVQCGECLLTETIANRIRQQLGLSQRAAAATAAPQRPRSNHFPNEALNKGFPDHISRDGTAYYSDGTVLPSAAPVEQECAWTKIDEDWFKTSCNCESPWTDGPFCTHCGKRVQVTNEEAR